MRAAAVFFDRRREGSERGEERRFESWVLRSEAGKGKKGKKGRGSAVHRRAGRHRSDGVVLTESDGHAVLPGAGDGSQDADPRARGAEERPEAAVGDHEIEPDLRALRQGGVGAEEGAAGADVDRFQGDLSFFRRACQGLDLHRHREIVAIEFPAFNHPGTLRQPLLWLQSIGWGPKSKTEKSMNLHKKIS